jgi:hypothetical protein
MRYLIGWSALVVLTVLISGSAWSSEADELRAKAKAVQHEAEVLAKEGRQEEADKLFRHAKELLSAADKQAANPSKSGDHEIDELHQQLKAIAEKEQHAEKTQNKEALAELREYRDKIEHALAERREHAQRKAGPKHADKHAPELPEPLQEAARRLKHLHVAIENLHAAGMDDVAAELGKRAEAMEREIKQAHEQLGKEPAAPEKRKLVESPAKRLELKHKAAPLAEPLDDLREELQRLRAELKELREEVRKRP